MSLDPGPHSCWCLFSCQVCYTLTRLLDFSSWVALIYTRTADITVSCPFRSIHQEPKSSVLVNTVLTDKNCKYSLILCFFIVITLCSIVWAKINKHGRNALSRLPLFLIGVCFFASKTNHIAIRSARLNSKLILTGTHFVCCKTREADLLFVSFLLFVEVS